MIYFDNLIFSLQKFGGISSYWYEISKRAINSNYKIIFIERYDACSNNYLRKRLLVPHKNIIFSNKLLLIDRFINIKINDRKVIFHSSYNRLAKGKGVLNVVTIHDFIHEKYYTGFRKLLHSFQKCKAITNADAIIAVSENTKKDLLNYYPNLNSKNINVIYNGVSEEFFNIIEKKVTNEILFVGSREKYKNFLFAVESVSRDSRFTLSIVGSVLRKQEIKILNRLIPGRWKLYNGLDNSRLNILYNNAFALLYPSSYEGFGIPLLEAMKSGCPFIALNSSSIPEVAGEAGVLMSEITDIQFTKAINQIIENRNLIIQKGFEQVSNFSWDKCYEQTLNVYKNLLDK